MSDAEEFEFAEKRMAAAQATERDSANLPWRPGDPKTEVNQVYSLRIPADRLEEIRTIADRLNMKPTVMMRRWVLDRLDQEVGNLQSHEVTAFYPSKKRSYIVHTAPKTLSFKLGSLVGGKFAPTQVAKVDSTDRPTGKGLVFVTSEPDVQVEGGVFVHYTTAVAALGEAIDTSLSMIKYRG